MRSTTRIAFNALMAGVCLLLLFLGGLLPTLRLALAALAGLPVAFSVVRFGRAAGAVVFAATALMALFLLPNKGTAIAFALAFGHYPILKSLLETKTRGLLEWALKLLLCNLVFAAVLLFFRAFFLAEVTLTPPLMAGGFLAGNIVFVLYDLGLSRLLFTLLPRLKLTNRGE